MKAKGGNLVKKIALGLIIGVILATAVQTLAANLTATTVDFTIVVNGEQKRLSNSPVTINGSAYLPLRATASLLGYDVTYDEATNTIGLQQLEQSIAIRSDKLLTYPQGEEYYGETLNGSPQGFGTMKYTDGAYYTGHWVDAKRVGKGVYTFGSGSSMVGEWVNDQMTGVGFAGIPDMGTYMGEFFKNDMTGFGMFLYPDGETLVGTFINGVPQADATFFNIHTVSSNDKKTDDNSQVVVTPHPTFNNASELQNYLQGNFDTLETCIGRAQFTFSILENTLTFFPYDYWIQVDYPTEFFSGAMNSISYTQEQKTLLQSQLRDHQEKIADAAMTAMPNKKFFGGYYKSWYRYPTIKVDLITRYYFTWSNYAEPDFLLKDRYAVAKPSLFRWLTQSDSEL